MPTTNIITAVVTAYCACSTCCGPSAVGLTASGRRAIASHTVAASRTIPFGSTVFIANHHYIVEDRLARRYDSRFDVFMTNHVDAVKFGIKTQQVTIITKGKAK